MTTTAVYVSNADSGEISVLHLDARTGSLTPVQQVPVGGMVMPLALSPDRRVLHAARRSEPFAALSFAVDPTRGTLVKLGEAALPQSMAYIATDRSGRYLFSASYGGNQIAAALSPCSRCLPPSRMRMQSRPIRRTASPLPPAWAAAS